MIIMKGIRQYDSQSHKIIKNAAFSFHAEGYQVSEAIQKEAYKILTGQKSADSVISQYKSSYIKQQGHDRFNLQLMAICNCLFICIKV